MRSTTIRRLLRDWVVPIAGLAVLGIALWFYFSKPAVRVIPLRMTAGDPAGIRYDLGEMLSQYARPGGPQISMVPSRGSEDALQMLDANDVQLALIQGGLGQGQWHNVRLVASLHVEPLHLLVRANLHDVVSRDLAELRGKRINLGSPGSGTYILARELLGFAGLPPSAYRTESRSYAELAREADGEALPDAVFLASTLPSPTAGHLVRRHGFKLVALPFAEAFALQALTREERKHVLEQDREDIDNRHIERAMIPAFTYRVSPGEPGNDLPTLGTRLLLVAHKDVPPAAIITVLDAVFSTEFAQVSNPPLSTRLLELPPEFPLHQGTLDYLARYKPIVAGDLVDFWEKTISITAAVVGGLLLLGQWLRGRWLRQRDLSFRGHVRRMSEIEHKALELETAPKLDLGALMDLQRALYQLKTDVLRQYAAGELEGEAVMSGFLVQVNEARNYLNRLILHQRDNLEEQALRGNTTVAAPPVEPPKS